MNEMLCCGTCMGTCMQERGQKCRWSGAHGGAGVVMSRGLMERIPHADMER